MARWVITIYDEVVGAPNPERTKITLSETFKEPLVQRRCSPDGHKHDIPHGHVEVIDPQAAAIVINEINDERGWPAHYKLDEYSGEWQCPECGERRAEIPA